MPIFFFDTNALLKRYLWDQGDALRSLDALQLASALLARDDLPPPLQVELAFVSSDKQLLGAAQHEGLAIIRPEDQVVP